MFGAARSFSMANENVKWQMENLTASVSEEWRPSRLNDVNRYFGFLAILIHGDVYHLGISDQYSLA